MSDVLLDTHIFLWLMNGDSKLEKKNLEKIEASASSGSKICISAVSVWEIGMLESKGRITFNQPADKWFDQAVKTSGIGVIELSADILLDSCRLPGRFHGDPADRMIAATSRIKRLPLVTQDEKLVAYIDEGYCIKDAAD